MFNPDKKSIFKLELGLDTLYSYGNGENAAHKTNPFCARLQIH